eukprot:505163_1
MNNTNNTNHNNIETKQNPDENEFKAINSVTSTTHIGNDYSDIPETKTFYPTLNEFANPLKYIQSIRDEGLKYGIIKIKPPKEWKPPFNLSFDDFKFQTKIQPIHILEKRVATGSSSSFTLTELRNNFVSNLKIFLGDNNIDNVIINKKIVYLYDLYKKVTIYGGYYKINNDKMWKNVGTELGVEYITNNNAAASYIVKLCYELYLLDYEQTHNFPGIIKDVNQYPNAQTPKQKYKNILINKPQQINKILRCNQSNNNDCNQFQTCSVCGQYPDSYNLANVILECIQCGNRWHSKCHEPQIPIQQLQLLLNSANGNQLNWSCTNCSIQRTAKFGYHSSGKTYSLNEYKTKADLFKRNYLSQLNRNTLSDVEWENIYWSIVDNGANPLNVEYGSEIPSKPEMTGFPMDDTQSNGNDGPINHSTHDFNLMNIKNAKGNIIKYLERDISGMTYPWIYVGMLFTAFGWHYEDHYAASVNYNHYGTAKQWYGIPSLHADVAETAMKECLNGSFEQFDLVTLVSPLLLHKKYNIPVYKTRQNPGEFVVTFPQSYHAGFNLGFNVAEAVNFATSDWLSFGLKCAERYRIYGRRQAFAHNELICNLCERIEILDLQTLKWLFESFLFIYKSHYEFIKTMLSANVTRGRPWQYDPNEWIKIKTQNAKDDLLLFDNLDNLDQLNYLELEKDGTGRMKYNDNNEASFDSDDEDDNYESENKTVDIGDVVEDIRRFTSAHVETYTAMSGYYEIFRSISNVSKEFRTKLSKLYTSVNNKNKNKDNDIEYKYDPNRYPQNTRFAIFIDRINNKNNENNKNKIILYLYPDDCNKIEEKEKHVPEIGFQLLEQCIIPKQQRISSKTPVNGQLITFMFNIEQQDEIRCYIVWNQGTMRFRGEHMVQVLPLLFENTTDNIEFIVKKKSKDLQQQFNKRIKDKNYDTFYQALRESY